MSIFLGEDQIIDLDVWGVEERNRLVEELSRLPSRRPTAVHSYHLTELQTATLKRKGILVFRRLEPRLLLLVGTLAKHCGVAA